MSSTDVDIDAKPPRDDDLLWGAQAMADELGVSLERIRYLIRTRRVPFTKLGPKTILASRRKLQAAKRSQFAEFAASA
jgi:hypothetical protein